MKKELENSLKTKAAQDLYQALAKLNNPKEISDFLRDVLTLEEIEEASRRFLVAKLLKSGKSIRETKRETGVAIATIVRINYWLHHGMGGYDLALEKLK